MSLRMLTNVSYSWEYLQSSQPPWPTCLILYAETPGKNGMVEMYKQYNWNLAADFISIYSEEMEMHELNG